MPAIAQNPLWKPKPLFGADWISAPSIAQKYQRKPRMDYLTPQFFGNQTQAPIEAPVTPFFAQQNQLLNQLNAPAQKITAPVPTLDWSQINRAGQTIQQPGGESMMIQAARAPTPTPTTSPPAPNLIKDALGNWVTAEQFNPLPPSVTAEDVARWNGLIPNLTPKPELPLHPAGDTYQDYLNYYRTDPSNILFMTEEQWKEEQNRLYY